MRPVWGAQINDLYCKSLICEESGNDIFRYPQRNYGTQKATNGLFATLSILNRPQPFFENNQTEQYLVTVSFPQTMVLKHFHYNLLLEKVIHFR